MEGLPKVVLLTKKATDIVLASTGIVAPLKEYLALQPQIVTVTSKINM